MASLLLVLIYLAFISLGLPDSLLGSSWPELHVQMNVPTSYAGIVTMIISGGTILSSLFSDKLIRKFNTGLVTAVSVALTALALLAFSFSTRFWMLCLWAIPYGLGAGAIDAALNNYVALHYSSRHMSWLHCFWGVGTIISPYIMSYCLSLQLGWEKGYLSVSILQLIIALILFFSLPLWKKKQKMTNGTNENRNQKITFKEVFKIKGVPLVLVAFFAYCSAEATVMLWASSYLHEIKNVSTEQAAAFASLFFIGITVGRFLSGFVSEQLGDKILIRIGIGVIFIGIFCILLPFRSSVWSLVGFVIVGLGCAPIYPSIIHATPNHFKKEYSQAIIGIQMASAYVGSTFMPLVFGLLVRLIGLSTLPYFLLFFVVFLLLMSEWLNRTVEKNKKEEDVHVQNEQKQQ